MASHYFSKKQESRINKRVIKARLLGREFLFFTGSGVFSKNRVDLGTLVLIDHIVIKDGWRVLDLGCGYGAIGICVAKLFPKAYVVLSDVNDRAVKLAKRNIRLNKVRNAESRQSDMFESVPEKFDGIVVNPPMMAGRKVCFRMIEESYGHLKENGLLQVVGRHRKGGRELGKKMREVFGNITDLGKKSGYRVYGSERGSE